MRWEYNSCLVVSVDDELTWDDSYLIALTLKKLHPDVVLENVSLQQIYHWTIALTEFRDDPNLANEDILLSIYREWYEEVNTQ